MKLITWNETYSVGIEEIDAQHQWLTDIINTLNDAVTENKSRKLLEIVLESLLQYTLSHFKTEEKLMEQYNYPDYAEHKSKHEELARKVLEWQHAFKNEDSSLTAEMLKFLKHWLENHELETDVPLGRYLNSKGVS